MRYPENRTAVARLALDHLQAGRFPAGEYALIVPEVLREFMVYEKMLSEGLNISTNRA